MLAAQPGDARACYLQAVIAACAGDCNLSRRLMQLVAGRLVGLAGTRLLDFVHGDYEQAGT